MMHQLFLDRFFFQPKFDKTSLKTLVIRKVASENNTVEQGKTRYNQVNPFTIIEMLEMKLVQIHSYRGKMRKKISPMNTSNSESKTQ